MQSPTPQHFSQPDELLQLPRAERRALLGATVTAEFKSALLMSVGDELPLNANYFDLGLTSLRVVEVKQRLEERLGCRIDAGVIFSSPTVEQFLNHLMSGPLSACFTPSERTIAPDAAPSKQLVDDILRQLYEA